MHIGFQVTLFKMIWSLREGGLAPPTERCHFQKSTLEKSCYCMHPDAKEVEQDVIGGHP